MKTRKRKNKKGYIAVRETIATGKTIDEAKLNGANELNVDVDDVTIEVLEAPKAGFLGLGAKPAKLLVKYTDPEEEKRKEEKKKNDAKKKEKRAEKAYAPVFKKEEIKETVSENEPQSTYKEEEKQEEEFVPNENSIPFLEGYLKGLFENMGFDVSFDFKREGKFLIINLTGDETGILIGKHGDTLDSLQHIVQLAFNKAVKGSEKIRIDTEGYREKREKTLVALAKSIASKVIKSKSKYELEPMKAYERKIIHATLQSYPMLTTYSVGVEPERRLIVAFKHRNQEHK